MRDVGVARGYDHDETTRQYSLTTTSTTMPAPSKHSNIRAFVHWREPAVYSGEEIECIITFRNVATHSNGQEEGELQSQIPQGNGLPRGEHASQDARYSAVQSKPSPLRTPSAVGTEQASQSKGHRPALSLNLTSAPTRTGMHSAPIQGRAPNTARPIRGHGRSLSIMSLGSEVTSEGRRPTVVAASRKPLRGHGRSASLQVMPKALPQYIPSNGSISPRQPSPLYESTTPPALQESMGGPLPIRPARLRLVTMSAGHAPHLTSLNNLDGQSAGKPVVPDFHFPPPPQSSTKNPSSPPSPLKSGRNPSTMHSGQQHHLPLRPAEGWSGTPNNPNPISRVMSESSAAGTPRSSSEFYSISNHSNETLASEMPHQIPQSGRLLQQPSHSRQASPSRQSSRHRPAEPETLMMAHVQTIGSFVLDGSLVNAAPFEEVKRKGVQSGGGVVGVQRSKRSSGMFGAFGWGNIGESLGGLLGGDDMSSFAQMKATAGSKTVPLLRTPQTLLFVDLRLAPGESKSYSYRFALPRGLPPTHRGRAIKVAYHLALGVQRPEGQAVKTAEIPFRVLGSYNGRGETLGHDLMSPYILLQDSARTKSIAHEGSFATFTTRTPHREKPGQAKTPQQGLEDFLRYTERLLEQAKDDNSVLLSPTSPRSPASPRLARQQSLIEQPPSSIEEAIDFAILRSNHANRSSKQTQSEAQSANHFNIARSGQPVAVLTVLRPAYRLGEAVNGTVNFTPPLKSPHGPSQAPTYGVLVALESAERVDPSLALRSNSSIHRITKKVHASCSENTLFAHLISFDLTIPPTATPSFDTTGVSLSWKLRVEFTVQRQAQGLDIDGEAGEDGLLEQLRRDEREITMIAREKVPAETFEIAVPIKVFGVAVIEGMTSETEALEV